MSVLHTRVTTKGQITLPKAIRESLSIQTGDQVEFSVDPAKQVTMRRMQAPGSSAGCGKPFVESGQARLSHTDERDLMLNEVAAKYGAKD